MDFAEAVYISELRTTPAGHASYRNVAYAMYEAVAKKYPALAKYFRVVDVREPVDLLKRYNGATGASPVDRCNPSPHPRKYDNERHYPTTVL